MHSRVNQYTNQYEVCMMYIAVSMCFTRRSGGGRRVYSSLDALLSEDTEVASYLQSKATTGGIALVFGREESGLSDTEVLQCTHAVSIPSHPDFPSLNLSHAVAIILAQLYTMVMTQQESDDIAMPPSDEGVARPAAKTAGTSNVWDQPVTHGEVDALVSRIDAILQMLEIEAPESTGGGDKGSHGRRRKSKGHVQSLLRKNGYKATQREIRSIFGLVKMVESKIKHLLESVEK